MSTTANSPSKKVFNTLNIFNGFHFNGWQFIISFFDIMQQPTLYAITDVETTGGNAVNHRITEIAVFISDGHKIVDSFQTLINPQRPIPKNIMLLTGITDEMVAEAPLFEAVAEKLNQLFADKIFVAHNVNFDFNFIKEEFVRCGFQFNPKRLCTVRLSRKLFPGLQSYSLGKLSASLGISLEHRHRAFGDAEATAQLFNQLVAADEDGSVISSFLKRNSGEFTIPPHLDKALFDRIPDAQGIYFLRDANKKALYIGQAKKLKTRIKSHFYGSTNTRDRNDFIEQIHHVDFEAVNDPLLLSLKEAHYIKTQWPRYNRALKRFTLNYGIFAYYDNAGIGRLGIGKCGKYDQPIACFRYQDQAKSYLHHICDVFALEPSYCGLPSVFGFDFEGDLNDYNSQYEKAIDFIKTMHEQHIITGLGRDDDEVSIIVMLKGRIKGYGYFPKTIDLGDIESLLLGLQPVYDDQDMQAIVYSYLQQQPTYLMMQSPLQL